MLSEKVIAYREAHDLTQVQLAVQIGTHPPVISNFETTGYGPAHVVEKLTKLIDDWEKSKPE